MKENIISLAELPVIWAEESERLVVGAMLTEPQLIEEIAMVLDAADFFSPAYQILFSELLSMRTAGEPVDVGTCMQWLVDRKQDGQVGGLGAVGELGAMMLSTLTWEFHAKIVRSKSLMRALVRKNLESIQAVYDQPEAHEAVLAATEIAIASVVDKSQGGSGRSSVCVLKEAVNEFLVESEKLVGKKNVYSGIPTGFYQLDLLLGGFLGGEYIVIAAPPGLGKTAFAMNLAKNMASSRKDIETGETRRPGHSVGFFSLEMTRLQLTRRFFSQQAPMRSGLVRHPQNWGTREHDAICLAATDLSTLPLYIDDDGFMTPKKFASRARWMHRHHKIEIGFVDYLQLFSLEERVSGDIETETTRQASKIIQQTSKALGIPFVVLVQFNKEGLRSGRPSMADIRGSGQIIQDAHTIIFLEEDKKLNAEREEGAPLVIKASIEKSRESEKGVYRYFDYHGSTYTFKERQSEATEGRQTY